MSKISFIKLGLQFIKGESFSSIILLVAMILALVVANTPIAEAYFNFWNQSLGFYIKDQFIGLSLLHWINDVLMSFFFLLVGLEIKREFVEGELSGFKRAAFPVFAALGGMIAPGCIYYALNFGTPSAHGYGIPMATDIAFALGVMLMLKNHVPLALKVFLVALAVVDDLGAVIVIAIFYTAKIYWGFLSLAFLLIILLIALNLLKVRSLWIYAVLGVFLWFFMDKAGIHATISAVILAFCIPLKRDASGFSPLEFLERKLQPFSQYLIMPLFAFANAGINFSGNIDFHIDHIFLGIFLGLFIGKPIGIFLFCFVTDKLGIARKPAKVTWSHIFGAGCLAGIGFTMSIFVTNLAFDHFESTELAKIAILSASAISAIFGSFVLFLLNKFSR